MTTITSGAAAIPVPTTADVRARALTARSLSA